MDNIGKLAAMKQQLRGERPMPATALSDDSILVKKIVAEHKPDGLEYDAKPLLHIVEDILRRATLSTEGVSSGALAHVDQVEDVTHHPGYTNMLEALSFKIDRIACEISYKSLAGVDAHSTALAIFDMLQTYEWDVKLVLSLAAFALTYGEFWLLAHMHLTNQLARSMAILKQVPNIMEHVSMLRPRFEALNELVKVILEVARCVIEFNGLPRHYIAQDTTAYNIASNHIPIATYWSVRGIVACATQITSLTTLGFEFMQSTTESWELSTLAHKLKNILEHLRKNLDSCYRQIEKRMDSEAYEMLRELFTTPHIDNMKVLKALISAKDDTLPLYDGATKKRVSLEPYNKPNNPSFKAYKTRTRR
ncbi:protein SIEVE ELEMENT OCCLUSION B [Arachis ipaensis]|uniref:protein SIEVE ELEMENT OCCLUSION B n=1 Tax=Arachis ipaensis TaxID=130454 RepID=UPI0007AF8B8C|nr:protein SIEVE ELEMENT OCCLUSION B [Arachis ipaensis]